MIDRELDEYKGDLQQILYPMFILLYLTMIRRGFEDSAYQFYNQYSSCFKSNNIELNKELSFTS